MIQSSEWSKSPIASCRHRRNGMVGEEGVIFPFKHSLCTEPLWKEVDRSLSFVCNGTWLSPLENQKGIRLRCSLLRAVKSVTEFKRSLIAVFEFFSIMSVTIWTVFWICLLVLTFSSLDMFKKINMLKNFLHSINPSKSTVYGQKYTECRDGQPLKDPLKRYLKREQWFDDGWQATSERRGGTQPCSKHLWPSGLD